MYLKLDSGYYYILERWEAKTTWGGIPRLLSIADTEIPSIHKEWSSDSSTWLSLCTANDLNHHINSEQLNSTNELYRQWQCSFLTCRFQVAVDWDLEGEVRVWPRCNNILLRGHRCGVMVVQIGHYRQQVYHQCTSPLLLQHHQDSQRRWLNWHHNQHSNNLLTVGCRRMDFNPSWETWNESIHSISISKWQAKQPHFLFGQIHLIPRTMFILFFGTKDGRKKEKMSRNHHVLLDFTFLFCVFFFIIIIGKKIRSNQMETDGLSTQKYQMNTMHGEIWKTACQKTEGGFIWLDCQ